jgi:hypothetical protein
MDNYKPFETNPMPAGYHDEEEEYITWEELKGMPNMEADRVRFISDRGFPFWDLSYFHVRIDGKRYHVQGAPFNQVPKKGGLSKNLYGILKEEGIYIPKFFDCISTMNC